jgi:putative transposase
MARLLAQFARIIGPLLGSERSRRAPLPSAGIIDSKSVKTTGVSGQRGFASGKNVTGNKRHVLIDTLGLPPSCDVTPAIVHVTSGAHCLLPGLTHFVPRLKIIWADQAYHGLP